MNSPSCSIPDCHGRPVSEHQRRNSAIEPAYALVVDSAPSRPNRTCRRNESATATTASSSSSTVQYLAPDGILTGNARIPDPRSRADLHEQLPATSTTPEETRRRTCQTSRSGNVTQQAGVPRRTPHDGINPPCELADGVTGVLVQPPGPHLGTDSLQGVLADRRAEPGEHLPLPGAHAPRPEREPQVGGASFLEVGYFRVFRSCGEVEALDGVLVVAGEVVFVAVAFLVIPHVVVEVAVDDDGAELKNGLGAVGGPSRAGNSESVFDDEPAGALDHAGGDGPALFEGLVVFHVLLVVRQVGDCPVHVGEVEAALAGVRAGFAGDGGEGGRDGLCAAVQDAQQLPVGPLARGGGVAGVQGGGGLADIAADVDVIDQDRHLQAALLRLGLDGGDLLPVPVDEEDPLAGPLRVAAVGLVIGRGDHVLDGLGNRRRYPFIAGLRPGVRLAAGGRGGDVPRLADGRGEVGDGDDLGHLLDPRVRG